MNVPMDAATQAQWNAWCEAHIARALAAHDAAFDQVLAKVISEERKRARRHVAKELGQLRAEIEILRSIVRGEVRTLKGNVDAA
jgi:hypothetical protein